MHACGQRDTCACGRRGSSLQAYHKWNTTPTETKGWLTPARPPSLNPCRVLQLVRGLGEAIVSGTVPGAALTFVARKDDIENPTVSRGGMRSEWG